jgi:hypothetical protein
VTILGLGADIAGNIALIIYLRSAIERAINAVIGHRLRDCIDWMGTSVSLPSGTLTEMSDKQYSLSLILQNSDSYGFEMGHYIECRVISRWHCFYGGHDPLCR